jgi:AraC-like DNA-binding protein
LALLSANGGLMAVLLVAARGNQIANRILAALVGLISLRMLIYVLGFAGAYDNHPWVTFAPLDVSLAFGPLLWLYVASLTRGRLPTRWKLHLLPAAVQIVYSLAAFSLPVAAKLQWYRGPHLATVAPLGLMALLTSCTTYLALGWRRQHEYQCWLDERFADRERWRLGWLTAVVAAFAVMVAAAIVATVVNFAITPLDYFGRIPVVLTSSLIAYALGLLGWRHAGLDLPPQSVVEPPIEQLEPRPSRPAVAFKDWARRVDVEGWWREERLTLADVANRLGVSERTLSRGLSEGAGLNFNEFVNGLRVEGVMRALSGSARGDLLGVAIDCGFSSKASFDRAFRRRTGQTPSEWRAAALQIPPIEASGAT